jgi:uncharacterized protein (UPF0548 family)
MFLYRRPSPREIETFLEESRTLGLSYSPVRLLDAPAAGFKLDTLVIPLGTGQAAYARARAALTAWKSFELGWTELFPRGAPVEPGTTVAVLVRHLGFWSLNGCRIVYAIGDDDGARRFGFGYGTLSNHAEAGEETFAVSLSATDLVTYEIRAKSRPRAPLAQLGFPFARMLQARFRRESAQAMAAAVALN